MKPISTSLVLGCLALLLSAGCTTSPTTRFSEKQSVASTWSPEVQDKVKAGKVEPGFSKEQVWVAMGKADRSYSRQTQEGSFEVWAYLSKSPSFSIGVGGGSGHFFGGGTVVTSGGHTDELCRIVFKDDKVISVEQSER